MFSSPWRRIGGGCLSPRTPQGEVLLHAGNRLLPWAAPPEGASQKELQTRLSASTERIVCLFRSERDARERRVARVGGGGKSVTRVSLRRGED
ncbi:hypothetical protein CEXT_150121 [Caerostris extrusa]|uniref:Uncharacterized protein n=1 Tax=Caerostris extrusa TaxID=172846 RepID=A0AAV4W911_CAEEX|nr:hypothetical protein CEXT_150121 [Caerostris extrusa]